LGFYTAQNGTFIPTFWDKSLRGSSSPRMPGTLGYAVYIENGVGSDRFSDIVMPSNEVDRA
jgi:hypothetical protein